MPAQIKQLISRIENITKTKKHFYRDKGDEQDKTLKNSKGKGRHVFLPLSPVSP